MSNNKAPKPLERVARIEEALNRSEEAMDSPRDMEHRAALLQTVLIEQAIDRLTHAVNRNTAAINLSSGNSLEVHDMLEAAEAETHRAVKEQQQ